jgi:hypothetical protein
MVNALMSETNLRLLLPETLWLEPEHYQQAKEVSDSPSPEDRQWQDYLTLLGRLAFIDWLRERLPGYPIRNQSNEVAEVSTVNVGDFHVCLIAVEHVLDEVVQIPKVAIEQPERVAHFYVVLEVLEDQEQIVVRGFLRHDELVEFNDPSATSQADESCQIPLAALDAEVNHLVFYVQQVEPSAILRPTASPQATEASSPIELSTIKTRLSQWLQGALDEGWQTIDSLISPEANLAWSTRHTALNAKGGKLINFGLQLASQAVVLLITVTPESEDKIGIGAQVLPAGGAQILPPQLKLTLLSGTDEKILQQVESREQDNYIQLKPFKGRPGTGFSIEVSLNDIRVTEVFEL